MWPEQSWKLRSLTSLTQQRETEITSLREGVDDRDQSAASLSTSTLTLSHWQLPPLLNYGDNNQTRQRSLPPRPSYSQK
ncbi:unnamed protein product [Linum trigynum]|uniref:Uncharacterized protein n=1 Tax=Linum trigynum TaxID=586398 RepID=A0AAV2CPS4_9ROSI